MSLLRQFLGLNTWIRALIVFVFLWGFLVYIFATKLTVTTSGSSSSSSSNVNVLEQDNVLARINHALQSLEGTKQKHDELKELINIFVSDIPNQPAALKFIETLGTELKHSKWSSGSTFGVSIEPSLEYEKLRRRIRQNTQEMWNYFNSELNKIKKQINEKSDTINEEIDKVISLGAEHKRSLIYDLDRMRTVDGYEEWRYKEAKELSDLVQRRLHYLQNPKDCDNARKLICKLNKGCGYGCQLHHVVYCFIVAYATERTLILKSKGWRYHKAGWEEVFHPVSKTCLEADSTRASSWPGQYDTQVLILPIIDSLIPRPPYLPLAIPEDLAPRLLRLHGDPIVWWVGQFLKYLLVPKKQTREMIESELEKLGFKKPIVGVHVRRTDKVGTEAAFHGIDEYMQHVEDYFLTQEINGTTIERRIFLASDDPRVINEAKQKYPMYEIIGDPDVAKMAAVSTRYTDSSLNGIILDIHMLSLCDYLVCTFSSQVCRVAYEIMQTLYPDASYRFKSLDDIYYYGGQNAHNREAVINHHPKGHDEIHMKIGDLVGVAGNHWNGFSKGKHTRTNQIGLFPSFKANDKVEIVKFPTYANVK